MRILYVVQRVPYPPNRGDKIPAYHAVRHLARKHQVTVAAVADSTEELEHARTLEAQGLEVEVVRRRPAAARYRVARALVTREPLSVAHYASPGLARRVIERARRTRFDVAVAFSSSMGQYVVDLGIPFIADLVDLDSRKWALYASASRWPYSGIYALESRRLLAYERMLARRAYCTLVRTEAERRDCLRFLPEGRIEVLANGVDLDYFAPNGHAPDGRQIVFTGVMDYFPNVQAVTHFTEQILPLVQRVFPDARFVIVGARPTGAVRALARRPGVRVTGTVPDVRPHLWQSAVAVAPLLLARGIQNKVLEAMAAATPVVTTSAVLDGVGAEEGAGALTGDTPAAFAARVIELLGDPRKAREVGRRGHEFVERSCRWDVRLSRLEALVEEAVQASMPSELAHRNGPLET
jgi:sugar transferase (PEP-CTERM/EpsH1 system associated)